jgi:hypothetical protein
MLLKLIPNRSKSSSDIVTLKQDVSVNEMSTEDYLKTIGVESDGVQIMNQNHEIVSTEEFLQQEGVKEQAILLEIKANNEHRRIARMLVLLPVMSMSTIIPLWLMILLTLTGLGKAKFSEQMQFAILGTGIADIVGLCYLVTSDLFPKGRRSRRNSLLADDEEDEA